MTDREETASKRYTTVSIPTTLYDRIKALIDGTGFTSVSQFVTYILRDVVAESEREEIEGQGLSEEEKRRIMDRLRRLGYL